MKVYTKTGDLGTTSAGEKKRLPKDNILFEILGTIDELNSFVGFLLAYETEGIIRQQLLAIQNILFSIGADITTHTFSSSDIAPQFTSDLETWMDSFDMELSPLRNFILPGGNKQIAICHICRTITRRLERRMVSNKNHLPISYITLINRLSDYFFVLSRKMAKDSKVSEQVWKP